MGMARKSRRNKSVRHEPKRPTPTPAQLLKEAKLQRVEQHIEYKELVQKHRGRVPVYALIGHRAIRLEAVTG